MSHRSSPSPMTMRLFMFRIRSQLNLRNHTLAAESETPNSVERIHGGLFPHRIKLPDGKRFDLPISIQRINFNALRMLQWINSIRHSYFAIVYKNLHAGAIHENLQFHGGSLLNLPRMPARRFLAVGQFTRLVAVNEHALLPSRYPHECFLRATFAHTESHLI